MKNLKKEKEFVRMVILLGLSFWALSSLLSETSFAASADFPKKEITIIVNQGPGGGRDTLSRGVGNTMSKYLGVPVVVLNLPGGGTVRGLDKLYNSAPDGYTIGVGAATDIILQLIEKQEYDARKFVYIGNAVHGPDVFFVKPDSPFHSLKDFKKFGKPIRISTFSLASVGTVAFIILAEREGFPMTVVGGYNAPGETGIGVIRGDAEITDLIPAISVQFVRSGQLRPFLVLDKKRCPDFPDTPTVGEVGYPELAIFALDGWFMAPPGIPKDRAQILENALMQTLKDPEFLNWAKGARYEVYPMTSQQTTELVLSYFEVLGKYKEYVEKYRK